MPDELQNEIDISAEAAAKLAGDISGGSYVDDETGLMSRLSMWATSAMGMRALGQMLRKDDPLLRWNRSSGKNSCDTCRQFDGVVKRASEWANSGYRPQSHSLPCGGWRCGCSFSVVDN